MPSPFSTALCNALLKAYVKNEAPGKSPAFVGLLKRETAKAVKNVAASTTKFKGTGFANNDRVVFTSKTGGTAIPVGRDCFVINLSGEEFELALTNGGAAISAGTEVTAGELAKIVEQTNSGESKRIATSFGATPVNRTAEDSTSHAIKVLTGGQVNYGGYFTTEATGEADVLCEVAQETFSGAAGTYTASNGKLDMLGENLVA
jgi:hypothetical protein